MAILGATFFPFMLSFVSFPNGLIQELWALLFLLLFFFFFFFFFFCNDLF
jgi:hypothetical protein